MNWQTRKYLSDIGRKGGKRSKRKLSRDEAKRIAGLRWKKSKRKVTPEK